MASTLFTSSVPACCWICGRNLQGQDRHGGEGLGQQLEGAVEDRVAQHQRIDFRFQGGSRCRGGERQRRGKARQEERLARARLRGRHRVGRGHQGRGGGCGQTEGRGEIAQEGFLRVVGLVVGLAHADRHLVILLPRLSRITDRA